MNSLPKRCLLALCLSIQSVSSISYAVTLDAFVEEAAQHCIFQNESAKIALGKSQQVDVKAFANQALSQSATLYSRLEAVAKQERMAVPTEPSLVGKAKRIHLQSEDAAFDRHYMDDQVQILKKQVFLFKKEAMSSQNTQLKTFAEGALPDLLKQQESAQRLQAKLKPSAGALDRLDNEQLHKR